jgi:hypothetical protein
VETIAVIRDIAVIFLAILNILLIAVLLVIAILIYRLIRMLSREMPEFIDKAKQMTTTAQGTADFVGSTVARPAISVAAFMSGVQRFLRVLAVGNRKAKVDTRASDTTEVRK